MKLTDQEQVVLKAIGHGVAQISRVIKAVGYPKATVKKILIGLNNKGVVSLHRHDYPASLSSADRKLMVKIGRDYFNAVSVRERNPKGKHLPGLPAKKQRQYEHILSSELEMGRSLKRAKSIAAGRVRKMAKKNPNNDAAREMLAKLKRAGIPVKDVTVLGAFAHLHMSSAAGANKAASLLSSSGFEVKIKSPSETYKREWLVIGKARRNPSKQSKGKTALKATGRALKSAARGILGAGSQILGAGAKALNPRKGTRRTGGKSSKLAAGRKSSKREDYSDWSSPMLKSYRKQVADHLKWLGANEPRASAIVKQRLADVDAELNRRKSKPRKRNLDHRDSTHQVKVHQHWRAGGLSQWQRAHHAGQHDLFAHGIKARPKRNAAKPSKTTYKAEIFDDGFKVHDNHGHHSKKIIYNSHSERITNKREAREQAAQFIKLLRDGVLTLQNPKGRRNASTTVSTAKTTKRRASIAGNRSRKATAPRVRSVAKTRKTATRRVALKKSLRVGKRNPDPKHGSATKTERLSIARQTIGSSPVYVFKWMGKWHQSLSEPPRHSTGVVILYPDGSVKSQKKNPSAESIRKQFAGSVNGERDLFFPQGTPAGKLAKLGKLVSITTEKGTIKPVNGSAWLCADTKERLHIGSTSNAPLYSGPARSFGKVTKVEYESSKPHLGYKGPIIWFHHMGEKGGTKPTLHADGRGGLKFRGGRYTLTTRGIEH